jgi:hypothetical protein
MPRSDAEKKDTTPYTLPDHKPLRLTASRPSLHPTPTPRSPDALKIPTDFSVRDWRVQEVNRECAGDLRTDLVEAWGDRQKFILIVQKLRQSHPDLNLTEVSAVMLPILQKLTTLFAAPFSGSKPR